MAEYTPDTDEVREGYDLAALRIRGSKDGDLEFDRWLNRVKAKAWDDGFFAATDGTPADVWYPAWDDTDNPYINKEENK